MTRAQWRQLAHRIRSAFNSRPTPEPIPASLQLDLWAATDHRIAAESRRFPWP